MIKVIKSEDSSLKNGTIGYIIDMKNHKLNRVLLKIILAVFIITIPLLIAWRIYEKVTKKVYLKGRYVIFGKNKYSLDDNSIKLEELSSKNGNTLLGTVVGGILFGGIGALGGAVLGSRNRGIFVLTDKNNKKTLIEVTGNGILKQLREHSLIGTTFNQ